MVQLAYEKNERPLIQFSELAKLPKPGKGCLSPKQIAELRQWASFHGKSVRQNMTRNFSTKDKRGTLPLNVYEASPPKEKTVDFNALLQDASTNQNKERTVFIPKEHMCCIRRAVDQDPCKQAPFTS